MTDNAHLQPMSGLRILVTRARQQASELTSLLRERGAEVVELPAIEIVPSDPAPLDAAIACLDTYDWLLFTSVNAVDVFFERYQQAGGVEVAHLPALIGAIGNATARRIMNYGADVAFVPDEFVAESMVVGLVARGVAGKRMLLPRARIARNTLPDGLRAAGADVHVVDAYDTRQPELADSVVLSDLKRRAIDVVTCTSPSTVHSLASMVDAKLRQDIRVACIGPITERAAREAGFTVVVTACEYSIPGLVDALVKSADRLREFTQEGIGDDID